MPLNANALTKLATVKDELGIADASQDGRLERLINVYSGTIERFCARQLGEETITEKLAGHGTYTLLLTRTPVASVTSVKVRGALLAADQYEVQDAKAGVLFRPAGWEWSAGAAGIARSQLPGTEERVYEVVYVGGYKLPNAQSGVAEALPAEVEEACIMSVVSAYRARGRDLNVISQAAGGASVTFASASRPGAALPDAAKALLGSYRRFF